MSEKKSLKNGWKILFKYLLEYKSEVILLSILGVISALANGTIPYITGRFFDAILSPEQIFVGTHFEMPLWLVLLVVFGLIQTSSDFIDWFIGNKKNFIGMRSFTDYHIRSARKILFLPISFHNEQKIGAVRERVNRAANQMENLLENVVIRLAPQFLSIFVGFVVVFLVDYRLFFILVFGLSLYVLIMMRIIPPIVGLQREMQKIWSDIFGDSLDALSNIKTVKRFTTEKYEIKTIDDNFNKVAINTWGKIRSIWNNISFYQRITVTCTRIFVFILSVSLIKDGVITVGELIAVNGYAAMVFGPFMTLGQNWQTIQNGLVNLEETNELLSEKSEDYYPNGAVNIDSIKGNIEFKDVTFHYNKKDGDVLKDINLKVDAGEIVALVGESGVGKSTLVELISAYYFAQKGKVLIDGVDIRKIDLEFLRKNIAVVPQEVSLFNDTIETNIKYGSFDASKEEVAKAVKDAHADEFIEKFPEKYKQVVGERGVKLYVGQKQRVAIARAILRNPKILILDEPTSALDLASEKYITESLKELMKGRTTFVVAHRLSTVRDADKIVVFDKGRIVEMGKHDDLMKIDNGVYKNLYNLHLGLE